MSVQIADEVAQATTRLSGSGLDTATEDGVSCCYAVQDKVWVDDPDGAPWEVYTVLADSETPAGELRTVDVCGSGACEAPGETAGDTTAAGSSTTAPVAHCC